MVANYQGDRDQDELTLLFVTETFHKPRCTKPLRGRNGLIRRGIVHEIIPSWATGIGDDELKAIWLAADQLDPQEGSYEIDDATWGAQG
jgi:hypothetical protein